MIGPGKYDDLCTAARTQAKAVAALLIIYRGEKGDGFSCQTTDPKLLLGLPAILRDVADGIEADLKKGETMTDNKRTPWTRAELDVLIPKVKAEVEAELQATEAEYEEPIKPLGPMTVAEAHDFLDRLLDIASQRPLTRRECFMHGQFLSCYRMAVMAEMLGKRGKRYFVASEDELEALLKRQNSP